MVKLTRPAEIALGSLTPTDRTKVEGFLRQLEGFPQDTKAQQLIKQLPGMPGLYNVLLHELHLLVFFRYEQEQERLLVLDVMNPERLTQMRLAA